MPVMTTTGLEEVTAGLSRLQAWAESDVLQRATKAGAEVIANAERGTAPEKTGALVSTIHVRKGNSRNGVITYLAGAMGKFFKGLTFYAGFQEFGWKTGKRGSQNRHEIPGEHFIQHAAEESAEAAQQAFIATASAQIDKELKG